MFSCTACKPSNPATSTVKVDPSLIANQDKENANQQNVQKEEMLKKEEQERERRETEARERKAREQREREEAERKLEAERREQQRLVAERREAEEMQQRREQEAQRAAEEEEQRRREEAQRRRQAEEERLRVEKEKAEADAETVRNFLTSKGYGEDINGKRKTMRKHYYPLHDAVAANDADLIRVLLDAKADPTLRSSSGKTALERAMKWNKEGSHDQVCTTLQAVTPTDATN